MPRYLQARHKELWKWSTDLSTEENIKILLGKMAIFRQAEMDEPTLELYTQALSQLPDMRALQAALVMLAESDREEGETALPPLGKILVAFDECREFFPTGDAKTINTTPLIAGTEQRRLNA